MNEPAAKPRKSCHLAWHVTQRCNRSCLHCLRRTPGQAQTDLPHDACVEILESFIRFAKETDRDARVEFSGGNPLVREDFFDLLRRVHAHKRAGIVKHIQILGNPETLDDASVAALKEAGLRDSVKVMVGGAPVTQAWADEVGADGYGANAGMAVDRAKALASG